MIFILGDKKYDTDKSEEITTYSKSYPMRNILGATIYMPRRTTLYRTKKGNWFSVSKRDYGNYTAYQETEDSAKQILKDLDEVELYNKHFGELEEA